MKGKRMQQWPVPLFLLIPFRFVSTFKVSTKWYPYIMRPSLPLWIFKVKEPKVWHRKSFYDFCIFHVAWILGLQLSWNVCLDVWKSSWSEKLKNKFWNFPLKTCSVPVQGDLFMWLHMTRLRPNEKRKKACMNLSIFKSFELSLGWLCHPQFRKNVFPQMLGTSNLNYLFWNGINKINGRTTGINIIYHISRVYICVSLQAHYGVSIARGITYTNKD